jgi:hypothetical protein
MGFAMGRQGRPASFRTFRRSRMVRPIPRGSFDSREYSINADSRSVAPTREFFSVEPTPFTSRAWGCQTCLQKNPKKHRDPVQSSRITYSSAFPKPPATRGNARSAHARCSRWARLALFPSRPSEAVGGALPFSLTPMHGISQGALGALEWPLKRKGLAPASLVRA